MKPDIYQYDDFRLFIRDAFEALQASDPAMSQREFARIAGFKNPGYLNDVVKGFKGLSENASGKMAKVLKLQANERDFLWLLAQYGQCRNGDEREELSRKLAHRRSRSHFGRHNPGLSKYFEDCRYALVRAAMEVVDFRGDYDRMQHFFIPPIVASELKVIVRDLCEWNLVEQKSDGRYYVTSSFVEPSPTMRGQVRRINREWIVKALDAQARFTPDQRHVSTILMGVSKGTEARIRGEVEKFREAVLGIVKEESAPLDRLMQLNIQYFPQSKNGGTV